MRKPHRQMLGLLKSKAMYYWKPFNRRKLVRLYRPFIHKNDLCFDIGAHIGNRMDAWLQLGAKVVALEPQPSCLHYLQRRFGNHPDVTLLPLAAGATPGIHPLKISNQHPTVTTLAGAHWQRKVTNINHRIVWDEELEVTTTTLDQLIGQYGQPAFCKIDVEGYEAEVLAGLSQPIPALSFEFFSTTPLLTRQCIDRLEQLGPHRYNWSPGESLQMALPEWSGANTLLNDIANFKPGHFSGDIYAVLVRP